MICKKIRKKERMDVLKVKSVRENREKTRKKGRCCVKARVQGRKDGGHSQEMVKRTEVEEIVVSASE